LESWNDGFQEKKDILSYFILFFVIVPTFQHSIIPRDFGTVSLWRRRLF